MEKLKNSRSPEKDYVYPEPAYNLDLCIALGQQNYLEGILDGVPQKNLKWMIQFAIDADDMKNGRSLQPRPDGSDAAPPPIGTAPALDPSAPPRRQRRDASSAHAGTGRRARGRLRAAA